MTNSTSIMAKLATERPEKLVPFKLGDNIEGRVVSIGKHKLLVDIAGICLGMIPEREFSYDVDDLNINDNIFGTVILTENKDGYVILSLKRADKDRVWATLKEKHELGEPVKVKVISANRGGLLVEFGGVEGFIPVSQLSGESASSSGDNDSGKNLQALRAVIGKAMFVRILTVDKTSNKLIFSEKQGLGEKKENIAEKVTVDTLLKGVVTGIVDFGLFVKVNVEGSDKPVEGLIHISEISWDRVDNIASKFKIDQPVEVVVISNKGGRLSLSLKRLLPDPWAQVAEKVIPGSKVKGEVTRVTPFGAFVKLNGSLDGLVHISELGENVNDPKKIVSEGKFYQFRVMSVDAKAHKISLSLKKESAKIEKDAKEVDPKKIVLEKAIKLETPSVIKKKSSPKINKTNTVKKSDSK